MQTRDSSPPPVRITGRHVSLTDGMKEFVQRKIANLRLQYPTVVEVHAILDVKKYRRMAEIVLRCPSRVTIKAAFESDDMYASIEQALNRVDRKMRKEHTRLMRKGLPRRHSVRKGPIELRQRYS